MKKKYIYSFMSDIIFFPLHLVGLFVPKNDKVWVFGCSSGRYYKDNTKYMYDFMSHKSDYRAIWLTGNTDVYIRLKNQGKECYYAYSTRGIYYALVAKFIFISYSYDDISFFCYLFAQRTKLVQLYHGTPLKRLSIERNRSVSNKLVKQILEAYLGRKFDFMFSACDLASEKFNIFFKEKEEKYIISGYPRNDALFKTDSVPFLEKIRSEVTFSKVVFYLPTYREYSNDKDFNLFDGYGFCESDLNMTLEDNDAVFLIKIHPNDYIRTKNTLQRLSHSSRVIFVNDNEIESDIYPIVKETDVLITDYSSVYIDFLLLDRPIIFASFDRNEYEEADRGFYFDYDAVTPGYKVANWEELCLALEETFRKDEYGGERARVNKLFNKYNDGESCQRIYNYLKDR